METALVIAYVLIGLLTLGGGAMVVLLFRQRQDCRRQLREAYKAASDADKGK